MLVRAKGDLQTIVLPEGDDERTLQAAERILAEGVANLVILGDAAAIEASPYALDGARIVDVRTAAERAEFAAAPVSYTHLRQRTEVHTSLNSPP